MRRLIRGERSISFGVLLALLAVVSVGAGVILFVLDQRALAQKAIDSERQLRSLILTRCTQRVAYDQRFVRAAQGDAEFYGRIYRLVQEVPLPADSTTAQALRRQEYLDAIADARTRKQEIVREGVISNCEQFKAQPTAYHSPAGAWRTVRSPVEEGSR